MRRKSTVLALALAAVGLTFTALYRAAPAVPFESKLWTANFPNCMRLSMAKDLTEKKLLIGKDRMQIDTLLGPANLTTNSADPQNTIDYHNLEFGIVSESSLNIEYEEGVCTKAWIYIDS